MTSSQLALGALAVRVSIEEPVPSTSAAAYVSESLYDVADVLLRRWVD
jgi:hypothetical protein